MTIELYDGVQDKRRELHHGCLLGRSRHLYSARRPGEDKQTRPHACILQGILDCYLFRFVHGIEGGKQPGVWFAAQLEISDVE